MYKYKVPPQLTHQFPQLVIDYVNRNPALAPLISGFPSPETYRDIIKNRNYSSHTRGVLNEVLEKQYHALGLLSGDGNEQVVKNLALLKEANTFTVCTGHQLNIFTGPLYTIYKVVTTIRLAEELTKHYPEHNFVPVFWLATEDHDFDEINHFHLFGKTFSWPYPDAVTGKPVGRLSTHGLNNIIEELKNLRIPESLLQLFEQAYTQHTNLANATVSIYHRLFRLFGLVILQPDTPELKRIFLNYTKRDILEKVSYTGVKQTSELLSAAKYNVQVNPREINYFYITNEGKRERIIHENNYQINNSDTIFSQEEFLQKLNDSPERFSPNVITRPMYQEVVLPNLAYIGGPGEISYWLELKQAFRAHNIPFPVLHLRNSFVLIGSKMLKHLQTLGLPLENYFLDEVSLKRRFIEQLPVDSRVENEISAINALFDSILAKIETVDKSKVGEWVKRINEQKALIKRLDKDFVDIVSQKLDNQLDKLFKVRESLIPEGKLSERSENLIGKVKNHPSDFITFIHEHTDVFDQSVTCLEI